MRTTIYFLLQGSEPVLIESPQDLVAAASSDASSFTATFCSLPEVDPFNLPQLVNALDNCRVDKELELACPVDRAYLVCQRNNNRDAFSVTTTADVACVAQGDKLFVLALPVLALSATRAPEPWETAVHKFVGSLPALCTATATKPLSKQQQLLRDNDVASPCTHPRGEPVFDSTKLDGSSAGALRTTLATQGFLRVRLSRDQMVLLTRLQEQQRAYFALPDHVKRAHSLPRASGVAGNYQPPFGYTASSSCRKEYFVVRQPVPDPDQQLQAEPRSHASVFDPKAAPETMPSASSFSSSSPKFVNQLPSDMAPELRDSVWPAFRMLGEVCQQILRMVLASLDIPSSEIEVLLRETMAPSKTLHEFGHTSSLELFRYHARSAEGGAPGGDAAAAAALPCSIHTDASLLTLVPRCNGPAGLEIFNWSGNAWQAVEAQSGGADECIVFAGDMLSRILNGSIMAAQHRVVFSSTTEDRYSMPFELFLAPRYEIDCARLLAHSWPHLDNKTLLKACAPVESAQIASCAFSQGLVSVNRKN